MASPVAHSLTGYLIYRLTAQPDDAAPWPPLWAYIAMANLPDVDIVFGLFHDAPFRYHHESIANSIGVTLVLTLLVWCGARLRANGLPWRRAVLFSALYGSHVLLDFFGAGRAVPILWPLDAHAYVNPIGFMPGFVKSHASNIAFFTSLMHAWNGVVILIEGAIFLPLVALAARWRRRR